MSEDKAMANAMLRNLLLAVEEVLGKRGLRAVLNMAGLRRFIDDYPPSDLEMDVTYSEYAAVEEALMDVCGRRGARGMLMRVGRATFRYGLEEQPAVLGLAGLALRFLPMRSRVKLILERVADASQQAVNQPIHIEEQEDCFIYVATDCPCRFMVPKERPACFVTVGAIQEALRWGTGKDFEVEEITCIATGQDACRYRIAKQPR